MNQVAAQTLPPGTGDESTAMSYQENVVGNQLMYVFALAILLVYQLIGESLTFAFGLPIPGPVIGLALLLATLALRPALLPRIKQTGHPLLWHTSLCVGPAGGGGWGHVGASGG